MTSTERIRDIIDAAQEVIDAGETLCDYRDDPDTDPDDKREANEAYSDAVLALVALLPFHRPRRVVSKFEVW